MKKQENQFILAFGIDHLDPVHIAPGHMNTDIVIGAAVLILYSAFKFLCELLHLAKVFFINYEMSFGGNGNRIVLFSSGHFVEGISGLCIKFIQEPAHENIGGGKAPVYHFP